jgi:glycosyltransferase involved in cell wall biosynthesis
MRERKTVIMSEFEEISECVEAENEQLKNYFGYHMEMIEKYIYVANKYGNISADGVVQGGTEKNPVIWWCWLQGLENAPELVKACYESCKQLGLEIKVITEENFPQYVTIPDFILKKREAGIISNTHFSDILRLELLTEYGGTWIDATVLITGKGILSYIEDERLFCFRHCMRGAESLVIEASSWFISACRGDKILSDTKAMLYEYWKNEDTLVHYFLFHFFFSIACRKNSQIWDEVPMLSNVPPQIMQTYLYRPYTKKEWERFCTMSDVHKLTWKSQRPQTAKRLIYDYIIGRGECMKYKDYIMAFDAENTYIHISEKIDLEQEVERPVMIVSNELTRAGAPIELLYLAECLKEKGYQVFLYSVAGGALLDDFLAMSCTVFICENARDMYGHIGIMAELFPVIFANTLLCVPIVSLLAPKSRKVYWWIHENSYHYTPDRVKNVHEIPSLRMLGASPKVKGFIRDYMNMDSGVLDVVVKDCYKPAEPKTDAGIHFLWAGSIDFNKAPDILLEAVEKLPSEYQSRVDFTICGKPDEMNDMCVLVQKYADNASNISFIPNKPHDELMELMRKSDVVVVSSVEETTSLVAVEALMMRKILICSDGCGVTAYLEDGKNAFIYPTKNTDALCEKIKYAADNFEELRAVEEAGRSVYLEHYSKESFARELGELLDG